MPGPDDPALVPDATMHRLLCDADITRVLTTTLPIPSGARDCASSRGTSAEDRADASLHAVTTTLTAMTRSVLYVGRSQRTVSTRLRRALEVRDGHCAFPDCRARVPRCHAHHVTLGSTAAPPPSTTQHCSASPTTTPSTKAAGQSGRSPDARATSRAAGTSNHHPYADDDSGPDQQGPPHPPDTRPRDSAEHPCPSENDVAVSITPRRELVARTRARQRDRATNVRADVSRDLPRVLAVVAGATLLLRRDASRRSEVMPEPTNPLPVRGCRSSPVRRCLRSGQRGARALPTWSRCHDGRYRNCPPGLDAVHTVWTGFHAPLAARVAPLGVGLLAAGLWSLSTGRPIPRWATGVLCFVALVLAALLLWTLFYLLTQHATTD